MDAFPPKIGPYVPERLLGRGAMAAVYLCRDPQGGPVAVKWLDDAHQALVERFDRECRALAELNHPSIVGWRDHGAFLGRPYLVMEYVEGTELRVYIDKLHRRPPAERYVRCRSIGVELCGALDHLHARGLVHRDIKPTNVLMAVDDRVVLSDLGVVQRDGDVEPRHGVLVGTPAYAAPEQAFGGRVDPRADLFGLGATLYHVLTRKRPFDSIERHSTPLLPPSRFDPGVPTDLEAVLLRLLAPDPAHRYRSASDVAAALAAGREEGVRVAGRQDAVTAAAEALRRAAAGEQIWVSPLGPRGAGRGWLARLIARSAGRRGLSSLVVEGPHDMDRVPELLAEVGPVVIVAAWPGACAPDGVEVLEVPLRPLGAADVRRTVVGFAPHTPRAANVAAQLHRLSGGLPALLVPLLQAHTHDKTVKLPTPIPPPHLARQAILELDPASLQLAAALAVLDRPASAELLTAILGPDAEVALEMLEERGIIGQVDGRATLTAGAFRDVVLEVHPDLPTLEARVEEARRNDPTVPGPTLQALCAEAEGHLRAGQLQAALDCAARATSLAAAVGDQRLECVARATWGRVLLETGSPREARRCLADATALARAAGDRGLRHHTHALRAWAELDERPGDPGAAAAALDRLMPLVTDLADEPSDENSAFACVIWARAAATLRDRGAWRRAARKARPRIAAQQGEAAARLRLLIAEGALAIHDQQADELIREAEAAAGPFPLYVWWGACLRARLERKGAPEAGEMARDLDEEQRSALARRGKRVGR